MFAAGSRFNLTGFRFWVFRRLPFGLGPFIGLFGKAERPKPRGFCVGCSALFFNFLPDELVATLRVGEMALSVAAYRITRFVEVGHDCAFVRSRCGIARRNGTPRAPT